ncbi:MAG: hypothetical protein AAF074_19690 [Pseudomonadota bacterium]
MMLDDKTFHALVGCVYLAGCVGVDKAAVGTALAAAYFAASAWCRHG